MPPFTQKPSAQQLLEQAMNDAATRAANSTNQLVTAWVSVASLNSAAFAISLLQENNCRVLSETMTQPGAARVLSVIAATTLDFFMSSPSILATVQKFGYQRSEDFERDVLNCFDSYGSTFLAITRASAANSDKEALTWSFALHEYIFIAVQAPEEDRVFSSGGEAIIAGHKSSSGDILFVLKVWSWFALVYSNQFLPQFSAALAAGTPRPQPQ